VSILRNYLLAWLIALSALLHAGGLVYLAFFDLELPVLIPPQEGRASIRLRASLDLLTEPAAKPEPAPVKPELLPLPQEVPEVEPPPPPKVKERPTIPPPPPPPPPVPSTPKPETSPPKRPTQVAQQPSPPSPASEASQGAVELPTEAATNVAPTYPPEALAAGQEGTVWLRIKVGASGRGLAVSIEESSGVASLDDSALRTARGWLFRPARRNGVAITYEVLKPIEFFIRRR
jgi:protein TonB